MTKEIYKTFEQWMNGNFLEVKEPRKKAYSKDELLLVEMGWKYGYDAGRAVEQALDKKAENARELGLDYEPVTTLFGSLPVYDTPPVQEPVAWTVSGKITDWSKDFSAYQTKHYTRPVYTPPAAQRQWVGTQSTEFLKRFEELVRADEREVIREARRNLNAPRPHADSSPCQT
jgi:hypothetical protein